MSQRHRLTDTEISERLSKLEGWKIQDKKLHKEFNFENFIDAFKFMTAGALACEKFDHHPEWSNIYNKVIVNLNTHDISGISDLDFKIATIIDHNAA